MGHILCGRTGIFPLVETTLKNLEEIEISNSEAAEIQWFIQQPLHENDVLEKLRRKISPRQIHNGK
jgi:hypothetical protein